MDESDVVMQVSSIWDLCELMDAGEPGPFEDYAHRLIEYALSELLATLSEE